MSAQTVTLPAVFAGIQSKVDRSWKLTFVTQELSGDEAAVLLKMNQSECWLAVAPSEDAIDQVRLPDDKPDPGTKQKTQAQRIRSILFLIWKSKGEPGSSFDEYYRWQTERYIDLLKERLDEGSNL